MTIEVLDPGALTTVQDAAGRPAWRHVGVPHGGAADPWAARLANRLVGNPDGAPLLEITLHGPTLRIAAPTTVALVGDMEATVDGLPVARAAARQVPAGASLRIGAGDDGRAYLAFAGGLAVPRVLGSASTDLRSAFGGIDGRALRRGDRLELAAGPIRRFRWTGTAPTGPIRIMPGPDADGAALDALVATAWQVGAESDRTGSRLDGGGLVGGEVRSMGMPAGAIEVPPDGRPIVMLADRPVTGGYRVPAVVIGPDVGRVARLRPGDGLRFASVSERAAIEARHAAEASLTALEPIGGGSDADDELGWAGAIR